MSSEAHMATGTERILEQFAFYRSAPQELRDEMRAAARLVRYEAGECFVHDGQAFPCFAMVGAGELRVCKTGESGRQITLYHVRAGETCIANMLCAILGLPSPATAWVHETVEAVAFPADLLREWMNTREAIRTYVLEQLATHLIEVMELVEEITFHRMDRRLAAYLLERFVPMEGARLRELHATHEDIARELGSAREVISRLLQEFERRGAIGLSRRCIELRDEAVLRQI